jgi:transposase
MPRPSKYSPEVRERAVRLVRGQQAEHESQWGAIRSMAEKLGCTSETLRRWLRQAERDAGVRPGLTTDKRVRLKELERENRDLKRANEILRKRRRISPRRSSTAERSDGVVRGRTSQQLRGRVDLHTPPRDTSAWTAAAPPLRPRPRPRGLTPLVGTQDQEGGGARHRLHAQL